MAGAHWVRAALQVNPYAYQGRNSPSTRFASEADYNKALLDKCDELGDPFINKYYALGLGLATEEEIEDITKYAFKVNEFMLGFFKKLNIDLIDFKIEFGRYHGQIILADEISPDTCRFWDATTHEKLDKDRFRRDMDNVDEGYHEIMKRLLGE